MFKEAANPFIAGPSRPLSFRTTFGDGVSGWVDRLRGHIRPVHVESLQALLAAVDAKDQYTRKHSITVAAYCDAIGRRMTQTPSSLSTLRVAALLHDVGKIGIPDSILNKPGPLDTDERCVVQRHPQIAIDILGSMRFLTNHRPIILHHHERYDGKGYPSGLRGEQIPLGARILAVADAIDTMLSSRTYKKACTLDDVRAELIRSSGNHFDPHIVGIALDWMDSWPEKGA